MAEASAENSEEGKKSHDWPGAIKEWSEAATMLLKAILYGIGIVVVVTVISTVIWRHVNSHVLVLESTPLADKTLRALGADVNLRLAVGDAINERINSISQIVLPRGLNLAEEGSNEDFSLRPIHLEGSTGDITRLFDFVFGRPSRPTIGLDIYCGSTDCLKQSGTGMRLVVSLPGSDGFRLASFPLEGSESTLNRSLHKAIGDAADTVLERYEPLPASVWFLDRPGAFAGFVDQFNPDLIRAVGAAAASRQSKNAGCLPDLVVGWSLMVRGEFEAGRKVEMRAANSSDLRCPVQAYTNIVFALIPYALNSNDKRLRQYATDHLEEANTRLTELHLKPGKIDDLNYYRVPAAALDVKVAEILQRTGRLYFIVRPPRGPRENDTANELESILNAGLIAPPGKQPQLRHGTIGILVDALRTGVQRENIKDRLHLAKALMDVIQSDESLETKPRALFMLEGKLATEMGVAANDALIDETKDQAELIKLAQAIDPDDSFKTLEPNERINFLYARSMMNAAVAFENALATEGLPTLVEQFSSVDAVTKLGDAHYAADLPTAAGSDYAKAASMFVQMDEPVGEAGRLVVAMAHWAAMQEDMGACSGPVRVPDELWRTAWTTLGWEPPDVCEFYKSGQAVAAEAGRPLITRMVQDALVSCHRPVAPGEPRKQKSLRRVLDLQDCLSNWAPLILAQKYSSVDVDQEIMTAMNARDAKVKARAN